MLGVLLYGYVRRKILMPVRALQESFLQVEKNGLQTTAEYEADDEFRDIFKGFNHMVRRLEELVDRVYVQQLLVEKANLRQLQAQINPHFLFNCFFILRNRIRFKEYDAAGQLSDYLGRYFRYVTRTAAETERLEMEVEHARIYAQIQGSRFSRRTAVEFGALPAAFADMKTERLILQPLLENAFAHGVEQRDEGGLVRVSFEEREGFLVISVEDNGEQLTEETLHRLQHRLDTQQINEDGEELTAVVNIHWRVRHRMGPGSGLRLSRSPLGGLKAELYLKIPVLPEDEGQRAGGKEGGYEIFDSAGR